MSVMGRSPKAGLGRKQTFAFASLYLSSGRVMIVVAAFLVFGAAASANGGARTDTSVVRYIKGRTIFSGESPKAKLSISREFRFIGTQHVNLHGNADAEQYVFAKLGRANIVDRFYLIQFEHFLPTNHLTYDYTSMHPMKMHNLQFNYDVKSFPDFGALLLEDEGSDGAAMEQMLARRHLLLPRNTVI